MIIHVRNKNTFIIDDFKFKCCTGKNGLKSNKKEGDYSTPKGLFNLKKLYFRKDRLSEPFTKLRKIQIKKSLGWCDDMNSKFYNKPIKINKKTRHEELFRKNNNYDLLIPIQYNNKKPTKNKGSAIFLHLTKNYKKTLGCVALKKKDMLILLKLINKKTKVKII